MEEKTSELLFAQEGDSSIVNCVQPRPFSMELAVSGIDDSIKIFEPVGADNKLKNMTGSFLE